MGPGLDDDLIAYYEQEAALGRRTGHGPHRAAIFGSFVALLRAEGRRSVVDVGAGPGLDVGHFHDAGFDTVGVDLTPGNVAEMSSRGLVGICGSIYAPPLASASFDAVWCMSTLVHVPDDRFGEALAGLIALARPGAPVAIGTWGGFDFEGISEHGDLRPYRFFALRNHERFAAMLAEHATVEHVETMVVEPGSRWEYQFAVVRPALDT